MNTRSLFPRMIAALLAMLGLLDAAYLTLNRYAGSLSLVCPVGNGCETVQTSRWSTLPPGSGIPIALIGVVGYAVLLGVALAGLHRDQLGRLSITAVLLTLASGGLVFALYLTALQLFVIGAICFWCVVSALLELGIFSAAAYDWWQQRERTIARMVRADRG